MPELAEVKLTSEFVNKHGSKTFVKIEKSPVSKVKTDLSEMMYKSFNLMSISRGKEMVIDFINEEDKPGQLTEKKRMKVTLGMSGAWIYYDPTDERMEKYHKHVHLRIIDSKGFILGLYDVRRFAKWSWNDFDVSGRGPCPFHEPKLFREKLVEFLKIRRVASVLSSHWKVEFPCWIVEATVEDGEILTRVRKTSSATGAPGYFQTSLHASLAMKMLPPSTWKAAYNFSQDGPLI